jgi:hypothetical protein
MDPPHKGRPPKQSPYPPPNMDALAEELDKLSTESVLEYSVFGDADLDTNQPPEAFVVIDLNYTEPMAAFIAPSLGIQKPLFLPAFEEMSKAREAFLGVTKPGFEDKKVSGEDLPWTTQFLVHCRDLLQGKTGYELDMSKVQVSLTTRSDVSEIDKVKLLRAAKDVGFKVPQLHVISTVDAVVVAAFLRSGGFKQQEDSRNRQSDGLKIGNTVLVICYDGDIIEIQSYSLSLAAQNKKYDEPRLRLEDIVSGNIVDCKQLAEQKFINWLRESFDSRNQPQMLEAANDMKPNGKLLSQFAKERQNYSYKKKPFYEFSLNLPRGSYGSAYDSARQMCRVPDAKMHNFCDSPVKSFLNNLDEHYSRIQNKKTNIDKILFAGKNHVAGQLDDYITDWGLGEEILAVNTREFSNQIVGRMTMELK